jgi:hypothetical protein
MTWQVTCGQGCSQAVTGRLRPSIGMPAWSEKGSGSPCPRSCECPCDAHAMASKTRPSLPACSCRAGQQGTYSTSRGRPCVAGEALVSSSSSTPHVPRASWGTPTAVTSACTALGTARAHAGAWVSRHLLPQADACTGITRKAVPWQAHAACASGPCTAPSLWSCRALARTRTLLARTMQVAHTHTHSRAEHTRR